MKKLWALGLLASAQIGIAAESFGGIGLAIYPSESGAEVAHVVQGSAAEKAGIVIGDFLLSANGVPLEGESLEYDMEVLRGNPGESLELSVQRDGEILTLHLEREKLVVQSETENAQALLNKSANEEMVHLDDVELATLNAQVYASKSLSSAEETPRNIQNLSDFSRGEIAFELSESGTAHLTVLSAKGQQVRSMQFEGSMGANRISWNGSMLPAGNYLVRVSQNGNTLYFQGALR